MQVLIIADIHGSLDSLKRILKNNEHVDLVLVCGDITHYNSPHITTMLEPFDLEKTLFVPGNCDTIEVMDVLNEHGVNIHGKTVDINGIRIRGIGGSNPTPFDTPLEYSEEELKEILFKDKEVDVLVSHAPPKGILDKVGVSHVGSVAIREYIEEVQPRFVFCGHIHEQEGEETLNNSRIINPGPVTQGKFRIVEL